MIVQESDVEQGDDLDRIVLRGRGRRASANRDQPENQEFRNPQCGKRRATGSEQAFAPARAPTTGPASAAIPDLVLAWQPVIA